MSQPRGYLTAIDIETALGNILNLGLNLRIPFCKIMNPLPNLIEGNIAFLPFGHLKDLQDSKYLPNLFIILFDIIMCNIEIFSYFIIHLSSYSVELDWLRDDAADVG